MNVTLETKDHPFLCTPAKINMEPGNDGETNRNLQTSKGPPFSGEPCLFWGGGHLFFLVGRYSHIAFGSMVASALNIVTWRYGNSARM